MDAIGRLIHDAQAQLQWVPPWAFSLLVLAAALALALVAHGMIVGLVRRALTHSASEFWRPLIVRTRGPTRLALVIAAVSAAAPALPLTARQTSTLQHGLLIGFIVLVGWMSLTALDIGVALYMRRYRIDVADNLLARKHVTQVRILRRALATLVVLFTIALSLMTISGVRQFGVSLLAAGGAASLIVGLALQPLLTNLMAGIQIAITQPIRIDDAVVVENEFGNVEEINSTYVVVRLWDQRRMVLPLSYFLQKPFQNWTRESASLIGQVLLYVDYSVPVDPLRRRLEEIVHASKLWDGKVVNLAVTDTRERTMELRCLISARNSGETFDLRCEVREKMIAHLQTDFPSALPRDRVELRAVA